MKKKLHDQLSMLGSNSRRWNVGNFALSFRLILTMLLVGIGSSLGQTVLTLGGTETPTTLFSQDFESAWTTPGTLSPAWTSAGTGNNQWQKDSYTTGWTSASGAYTPTGGSSTTGSARFHTYDATSGSTGDLISPTVTSPAFPVEGYFNFSHINTSGADALGIWYSLDNGATWTSAGSLGINASWVAYTVTFWTVNANTNMKFKFTATSDYGFTDIGIDQVSFTYRRVGAQTWTVPAGVSSIQVETWGAGGAGGTSSSGTARSSAGGGGGGAYAKVNTLSVTAGQTIYYNIGAGGANNGTQSGAGSAGGDTWFNKAANAAPTAATNGALAKGGSGGTGGNAGNGGAGGTTAASIGDSKFAGGFGGKGATAGLTSASGAGAGSGGNSAAGNFTTVNTVSGVAPIAVAGGVAGVAGISANGGGAGTRGTQGGGGGSGGKSGALATFSTGGRGGNGTIVLTYTVTCTAPTTQATIGSFTNNGQGNSITVNWTNGNGNATVVVARLTATTAVDPINGSTYTANAAFGSGSTTGTGNFVVYNGTGTSVNVTGLTNASAYTFTVYTVATATNCYKIPGSSAAVTITGYCASTSTSGTYYISNFTTSGGNTNISNATNAYSASGYGNFIAQAVSNYIGGTTNFTTTWSTTGGVGFGLWIDWNNDLDFADANETVYISSAYNYTTSYSGSISVPAGTANGNYRMRIKIDYNATVPANCGVITAGETEDYTFTVVAAPACAQLPSALVSSNITATTATISWTAASPAPGSGYDIYYSTSATAPTAGTAATTTTAAGVVTKNLTGLTANTTYYFWVRSNCNGTDKSNWVGSSTFFTGYCLPPANTNTCGTFNFVSFSTSNGSTNINNPTSCTSEYTNYSATLSASQYATGSLTCNFGATGSGTAYVVFVDWNNDLDFVDVGETVLTVANSAGSAAAQTGSFTIPTGTALGNYRMRVRGQYYFTGAPTSPCSSLSWGETEDYTLQVIAAPTCFPPTALTASNIATSTATISWSAASPAPSGGYQYYVSTSSTAPIAGTTPSGSVGAGILTANLTGLTAGTTYYYWVRSFCGGSDYSTWTGTSFNTLVPGDNCSNAIDLATLTSPYSGTTTGSTNDFTNTCASGNTSPDLVYYINVPNGAILTIGQTVNGYDSENTLFYGGACPGTTQIACFDDPDVQNITWTNTTGSDQTVYWVQDGFFDATNNGTFTLAWSICIPGGDATTYGNDSWNGYVYNSAAAGQFTNYVGLVTEAAIFNRTHATTPNGATTSLCGPNSDLFAIRYKMTKNFPAGDYIFTIGGDDGVRLSVDGGTSWLINNWIDQSYAQSSNSVPVSLNGSTNLVFEFYENTGGAQSSFDYVLAPVPACATYTSPADGATGQVVNPTLTWGAVANATSYDVYIGAGSLPSTPTATVTGTSYSAICNGLTTYMWKVVPKNAQGAASGCATWSFTTMNVDYAAAWISANTGNTWWCQGETRTVTVTIKNNGTVDWIDGGGADYNVGIKWNAEPDYIVRVDAQNLAAGATGTFTFTVTAPTAGNNNLTFDVVREACFWFGTNATNCGATAGPGNSAYSVTANVNNTYPTANAGPDNTVCLSQSVTLSGTASVSAPDLSNVLAAINANVSTLTASIPTPYGFTMDMGVNSNFISDGGNDMYDGGNYINTNLASNIMYSDNAVVSSASFGTGGKYFTRAIGNMANSTTAPTIFYCAADLNGLSSVSITGDNGADGSGTQNINTFTVTSNNVTYNCFLKRVYGATDPSINQLFMIPQPNSLTAAMGTTTNDNLFSLSGLTGVTRMYYMLYAGNSGTQISVAQATSIAQTFANVISASATVAWSSNPVGFTSSVNNPVVSPTIATTYTLSATFNGCSSTDNVIISVNTPTISTTATNGDVVWSGSTSDWSTPTNWLAYNGTSYSISGSAPTSSTRTIIPASQTCVSQQPSVVLNGIVTAKDVVIESGAILTLGSGSTLNIHGNYTNNGTLVPGSGTVAFTGTGTHTLSGSSVAHNFNNVTMNKAGEVQLSVPIAISGALTLTNGRLDIGNFNLDLPTNTINGGNANSYVKTSGSGTLNRDVAGIPVSFPVGRAAYNPATLTNAGTADKFSVRVIDNVTDDGTAVGTTTSLAVVNRTWMISEQVGGGSNVTLGLNWNGAGEQSAGFQEASAFIAHYISGAGLWDNIGGAVATNTIETSGITSFSPFTISSDLNFAPLPVELMSFSSVCLDNDVAIKWTTASENNSMHFVVETSTDGVNWEVLSVVPAAQFSTSILNYAITHEGAARNKNYYRLIQVDLDGAVEFYNVIYANCGNVAGEPVAFPNPSNGNFTIDFSGAEMKGVVQLSIMNAEGKEISNREFNLEEGVNTYQINNMELQPGIYYLKIVDTTGRSFIIKHSFI